LGPKNANYKLNTNYASSTVQLPVEYRSWFYWS